jgi:DNA invertase Pin-like site-specific DNA recombinase
MVRAFAYLRVSGKAQIGGDGFPRQLAAVKTYAAEHGIKIVRVFREEGVSGTVEGMDRPMWAEMVGTILANGVRTILVESLGRLARELFVQEYILRDMKQRDIALISVTEPDLGSTDPTRVMFRQILGAIHQYEKTMIVLKLRGARARAKAKNGRCEGAKPYGNFAGEAEVIERMKALRASGMGFDRIAAALNAEGIRPRRGEKWWGLTVNNILTARQQKPEERVASATPENRSPRATSSISVVS